MYCSTCATPLTSGLSYCNRCGANLKEHEEPKTDTITAFLTVIGIVGIAGLVLMLGGAIALKNGAQFHEDLIGIFMLMTFLIVGLVEILLCWQLARVIGRKEKLPAATTAPPALTTELRGPADLRSPAPRALGEPLPSVTENTTRTLNYARNEPLR